MKRYTDASPEIRARWATCKRRDGCTCPVDDTDKWPPCGCLPNHGLPCKSKVPDETVTISLRDLRNALSLDHECSGQDDEDEAFTRLAEVVKARIAE